jgi:hypothetical protein
MPFIPVADEALLRAAENGHAEVVSFLLTEHGADPAAWDYAPIRYAACMNHGNVVSLLLAGSHEFLAKHGGSMLYESALHGDDRSFAAFMADPLTRSCEWCPTWTLIQTVPRDHPKTVSLLLKDPRVDPSAGENQALADAARHGLVEVAAALLADPRVDPAAFGGRACRLALEAAAKRIGWMNACKPEIDRQREAIQKAIAAASEKGGEPGRHREGLKFGPDPRVELAALFLEHPRVDPALLDPPEFAALRAEPRIVEALARRR